VLEALGVIRFLAYGVEGAADTKALDLALEGLSEGVLLAIRLCPCNLGNNVGQAESLKEVI
jgi:hypothetical protein